MQADPETRHGAPNQAEFGDPFFRQELAKLGPRVKDTSVPKPEFKELPPTFSLRQSEAYCRMWAKRQYENFAVVSFLLPRRLRQDFYNFYAYCRWSDNLADEIGNCQTSSQLLELWKSELQTCFEGTPQHPVLIALQATIQRHELPADPLFDLLSAFQQDQEVFRYATHQTLVGYCQRSANPVGRVLLRMARADQAEQIRLSDLICTGLQLANFCQDMARDAAAGRIYAPLELQAQYGVTEAMLLARQPRKEMLAMLQDWVAQTHHYFHEGRRLVGLVPRWLRIDIELFISGGQAILHEIEAAKFDVWTRRPVVSKWQKLRLLLGALQRRVVPYQTVD